MIGAARVKHEHPFTEILDLVERAYRNRTRAHFDVELIEALVSNQDVYAMLAALKQKELVAECRRPRPQEDPAPLKSPSPTGSNMADIGSGIAPTETTGISAGSMDVSRAAENLALEAAAEIIHLNPRKRR